MNRCTCTRCSRTASTRSRTSNQVRERVQMWSLVASRDTLTPLRGTSAAAFLLLLLSLSLLLSLLLLLLLLLLSLSAVRNGRVSKSSLGSVVSLPRRTPDAARSGCCVPIGRSRRRSHDNDNNNKNNSNNTPLFSAVRSWFPPDVPCVPARKHGPPCPVKPLEKAPTPRLTPPTPFVVYTYSRYVVTVVRNALGFLSISVRDRVSLRTTRGPPDFEVPHTTTTTARKIVKKRPEFKIILNAWFNALITFYLPCCLFYSSSVFVLDRTLLFLSPCFRCAPRRACPLWEQLPIRYKMICSLSDNNLYSVRVIWF